MNDVLNSDRNPVQLHVLHNLGGGVEHWCRDYCDADQKRVNLILKPFSENGKHGSGLMLFTSIDAVEPERFWFFDAPFEVVASEHSEYRQALLELVHDFGVGGILVSSLIGHSLDVLDTGLPTLMVTHDYFPLCPAIYAYFESPCTECGDARLAECHKLNFPAFDPFRGFETEDRIRIRRRILELLRRRSIKVVHPTGVTKARWHQLLTGDDEVSSEVIPHGEGSRLIPFTYTKPYPDRLRVLVLGLLNEHKGLNLLRACMPQMPDFVDLLFCGSGVAGKFFENWPNATVIERYSFDELQRLTEEFQPDIGLLASICPETFSYVLSEFNVMGIPVLASRAGSFIERIQEGENGYLFDPTPKDLIDQLVQIHADRVGLAEIKSRVLRVRPRTTLEMVEDYHKILPLALKAIGAARGEKDGSRLMHWARRQAVTIPSLWREAERLRHGSAILGICLDERLQQLADRDRKLADRDRQLADRDRQLADRDRQLADRDRQLTEHAQMLAHKEQQLEVVNHQLRSVLESTSWLATRPFRVLVRLFKGRHDENLSGLRYHLPRLGKKIYWHLPVPWRRPLVELSYRVAGPVFRGAAGYEHWRHGRPNVQAKVSASRAGMVDISTIPPYKNSQPGKIAIHAHIFYGDLAGEFAGYFANMPYGYDLYVSVPDEKTRQICERTFSELRNLGTMALSVVQNRGRDIAPMFCEFGEKLKKYDYLAHLHSKKSLYNEGRTAGWREHLLDGLLGSRDQIARIFALLSGQTQAGMVYPQTYVNVPYQAHTWLATRALGSVWCNRLGIWPVPSGYFDFPAGSMFWARVDALRPLFEYGIRLEDFPPEQGQTDGTLAHCIERLIGLLPPSRGYPLAILRDSVNPGWSKWRCDGYFARSIGSVWAQLVKPSIKVVAFDIFDTLILRPLINPEHTKKIISIRAGGALGDRYLRERAAIEQQAREHAGRDVGLDDIYREWASAKTFSAADLARLRSFEESVELASAQARPEVIALFNGALAAGKRVVLVSDMFLPGSVIEKMLAANGIVGWHRLYLSNEVGSRKDDGELYRYLLDQEGVDPHAVAMVGDNERSDVQIPGDMGFGIHHVFRPLELARCLPRWSGLIERFANDGDLNVSAGLGMVLKHRFAAIEYPSFSPGRFIADARDIGYTVAGPICLAFASWLGQQSEREGIDHLYFLSREGAILKKVYDRWHQAIGAESDSRYLVLSRRAVAIPMIENLDDVFELARPHYYPNDPDLFLSERYGLALNAAEWDEIQSRGLWNKGTSVEVRDGNIEQLKPLLGYLYPAITAQAASERPALLRYLESVGLFEERRHALVDIGYSGSIQGRLNRLLQRRIDGFYILTNSNAKKMAHHFGAIAQGCFDDGIVPDDESVPFNFHSFKLEKLLSSDEEQVLHYSFASDEKPPATVYPVRREPTATSPSTQSTRREVQAGIMAFVDDAIKIRRELLPGFDFPVNLAADIFACFVTDISLEEEAILKEIVLDDFYCGRGLVA